MTRSLVATILATAAVAGATTLSSQQPDDVSQLLARASRYVTEYEPALGTILLEERYRQEARGGDEATQATHGLRSDVAWMNLGAAGWITFRDVFEVDGRPVRDRNTRLVDLLLKPRPDSLEQADRIIKEGARFNVGGFERTINTPTLALVALRPGNQSRFAFTLEGTSKIDKVTTSRIAFHERDLPRLVSTRDDAPSSGRFWIDPATGRVFKSEFSIQSAGTAVTIVVTYAMDDSLKLMVPASMSEEYRTDAIRSQGSASLRDLAPYGTPPSVVAPRVIVGQATYGKLRRIVVDVSVFIKQ